jgi:SAM-dependent methyltransferase
MIWQNYIRFRRLITTPTIHKTLNIPPEVRELYDKQQPGEYMNDVVFQTASPGDNPVVLDAGCGFGSTIFRWYSKSPGKYTGYSLSSFQVKKARQEAARRRISEHCQFFLKSYNDPIEEKYQFIIAIESLIHANDLQRAISNLGQALQPGGKLIIVDDMAETDPEWHDPDLDLLKKCWSLSQFRTQQQYLDIFKINQLKLTDQKDFTAQVRVSTAEKLKCKKASLKSLYKILPIKNVRFIINAYLGGFALEELYRRNKVKYILLAGQKE